MMSQEIEEIIGKLLPLIEQEEWKQLKSEVETLDPILVSESFEELSERDKIIIFRLLDPDQTKIVFKQLSHEEQEEIIEGLAENANRITRLLNDIEPDDRTAFLEELPGEVAKELIRQLSPEQRAIANQLLGYPKDSIGRLMTTEYVAVKADFTIEKTFSHIRKFGHDSETLNVIYVVDDDWRLVDDLTIKQIILADPQQTVGEIINNQFVSLNASENQEAAIQVFKDYDRVALPVIGERGILLGIVTFDDIMDVAEEETSEDFHKFGGTEGLDLSYTDTKLFTMVQKRAGWLIILFLGEMLTASAMGQFQSEIEAATVLAMFIPLIISSGGNTGSQAASLIIRSMAIKELKLSDWWYVMKKEVLSGLLLGTILGTIGFIRIAIWQEANIYDYGPYWMWIALSVGISLIGVVLWGTLSGSLIPFILKRFGLDPATASAPFVATLVDVTGLIIYFAVAMFILSGKLL